MVGALLSMWWDIISLMNADQAYGSTSAYQWWWFSYQRYSYSNSTLRIIYSQPPSPCCWFLIWATLLSSQGGMSAYPDSLWALILSILPLACFFLSWQPTVLYMAALVGMISFRKRQERQGILPLRSSRKNWMEERILFGWDGISIWVWDHSISEHSSRTGMWLR